MALKYIKAFIFIITTFLSIDTHSQTFKSIHDSLLSVAEGYYSINRHQEALEKLELAEVFIDYASPEIHYLKVKIWYEIAKTQKAEIHKAIILCNQFFDYSDQYLLTEESIKEVKIIKSLLKDQFLEYFNQEYDPLLAQRIIDAKMEEERLIKEKMVKGLATFAEKYSKLKPHMALEEFIEKRVDVKKSIVKANVNIDSTTFSYNIDKSPQLKKEFHVQHKKGLLFIYVQDGDVVGFSDCIYKGNKKELAKQVYQNMKEEAYTNISKHQEFNININKYENMSVIDEEVISKEKFIKYIISFRSYKNRYAVNIYYYFSK